MEQAVKIDVKQRQALEKLLRDKKERESERLREASPVTRDSVMREILNEEGGAALLLEGIEEAQTQIDDLEKLIRQKNKQLNDQGFDVRDSKISFNWDAPNRLRERFTTRLEQAHAPIERTLEKYDRAVALVWAATSPDELNKSIKDLL